MASLPVPPFSSRGRPPSVSSENVQNGPCENGNNFIDSSSPNRDIPGSSYGSSVTHREPIRSFIHGTSVREHSAPIDSAQIARSVRQDTAELASYGLSDRQGRPSFRLGNRDLVSLLPSPESAAVESAIDDVEARDGQDCQVGFFDGVADSVILEETEPSSPELCSSPIVTADHEGPSLLATMLRRSPPGVPAANGNSAPEWQGRRDPEETFTGRRAWSPVAPEVLAPTSSRSESRAVMVAGASETSPLLRPRPSFHGSGAAENGLTGGNGRVADVENQKSRSAGSGPGTLDRGMRSRLAGVFNKKHWSGPALWRNAVVAPASCLPAVTVGLLLNVLDALSYGMLLFPLGNPVFSHLGSAGISVFYVSCIISQLVFSSRSIFKGAVGSELIEVVPFFHNMAGTVLSSVGADQKDAVIATTIVSYALSSLVTGTVFYLLGAFRFGYIIGFIPRHILIGCIGGVGWFLIATGFEVSARLAGSLEYDLDTLKRLLQQDTVLLWLFPFILSLALFYGQAKIASKYFLPLYILCIPVVFYFFVFSIDQLHLDSLRDAGWVLRGPPAGEPWWYFYTLYQFNLVRWDVVAETIPAMLALSFFGILHVPINIPALALSSGEDAVDLDFELKLHGYSNALSGLAGSIQNYLVYANTVFFMRSGGDRRLAGFMLAFFTFLVMLGGPVILGLVPVMMVGTLIFCLGFELLLEAAWQSRKKLKPAEYATVIVIVLVMGIYDFVVGIFVGLVLACASLIIQTARVSPVRGSYSGDVLKSTVRRNPSQQRYLQKAGSQIYIVKLTGYLFFGTIVGVQEKIRTLVDDHSWARQPIRYLILDMWHVTGLDFSAGEAFNTVSRLLGRKGVVFILSGVPAGSQLERSLRTVGLGRDGSAEILLPDLNTALESCENELLKTLYANQAQPNHSGRRGQSSSHLDVPVRAHGDPLGLDATALHSPRLSHLREAARHTIAHAHVAPPPAWDNFREPLRLMLHIFHGLSDRNEDFWFPAAEYFTREIYLPGTVLYKRGDPALGFYLVERGMLRAEYDLPQGRLCESIAAGTTCGELPFFSETSRTATVVVEAPGGGAAERGDGPAGEECVLWLLDKGAWGRLRAEQPEVAQELLRVSLKLTSERMSSITSYVLAVAG